jgi:RNA polymerase sigma-70 factor, ECF subfamily
MLVVLETLTPAERLAFVLHDMFAVPFDEIAPIMERSPEATRQLASRARRRVRGADPVPDPDLTAQWKVVEAFLAAAREGDFDALVAVLDLMSYYSEPTAVSPAYRSTSGVRRPSPARPCSGPAST